MGNAEKAVVLSLALHGLLAAGFVFFAEFHSETGERARLDISTVELSLADDEQETAPARPSVPVEREVGPAAPVAEASPAATHEINVLPSEPVGIEPPLAGEPAVEMHFDPSPPAVESFSPSQEREEQGSNQARVDAPAKPVRNIRPVYPPSSRRRGEQGRVNLSLNIDAFGAVAKATVTVSSGFVDLDAAALKAVRSARFVPAKRGEQAVESVVGLTLVFKLK